MLDFDFPEFDPDRSVAPLALMWPRPGNPGPVYLSFSNLADWRRFIEEFELERLVPGTCGRSTGGRRSFTTSAGSTATALKPESLPRSSPWSLPSSIDTVRLVRRDGLGTEAGRCWPR